MIVVEAVEAAEMMPLVLEHRLCGEGRKLIFTVGLKERSNGNAQGLYTVQGTTKLALVTHAEKHEMWVVKVCGS